MEESNTQRGLRFSFWLSVLLHVLLLLFFYFFMVLRPTPQEKQKTNYVPSYVYTAPPPPTIQKSAIKQQQAAPAKKTQPKALEAPLPKVEKEAPKQKAPSEASSAEAIMASSYQVLNQMEQKTVHEEMMEKDEDPIYLVGEQNGVSDPLIIMMGKALSAHFAYPRKEGELGIRGVVYVDLTLNPDGSFSRVKVMRSSNNDSLDNAALYAVNTAPIVRGADRFIQVPKHFVVGFIFH